MLLCLYSKLVPQYFCWEISFNRCVNGNAFFGAENKNAGPELQGPAGGCGKGLLILESELKKYFIFFYTLSTASEQKQKIKCVNEK